MNESLIHKIKKNGYVYFSVKLVILFFFVFLLDFTAGNILRYWYFKQESGMHYRTTYAMEKTKADVLIVGSSRANHHYHPEVFEERLKLTYYNAGRDANHIFYHYAVLKAVLKRYTPKIIVLNFVAGEFIKSQASYDRISSLLPYYKNHPEIRSIIDLKSPYERIKLISSIYPFNSSLFTIAVGNTEFNKKRRGDNKGYIPFTRIWNQPIKTDNKESAYETDSIKINVFKALIDECKKSNVQLFIFCSPLYIKSNQLDYSISIGKKIATEKNVYFVDFTKDSIFQRSPNLFYDETHLNDDGAKVYSNKVIDEILKANVNNSVQTPRSTFR